MRIGDRFLSFPDKRGPFHLPAKKNGGRNILPTAKKLNLHIFTFKKHSIYEKIQ